MTEQLHAQQQEPQQEPQQEIEQPGTLRYSRKRTRCWWWICSRTLCPEVRWRSQKAIRLCLRSQR